MFRGGGREWCSLRICPGERMNGIKEKGRGVEGHATRAAVSVARQSIRAADRPGTAGRQGRASVSPKGCDIASHTEEAGTQARPTASCPSKLIPGQHLGTDSGCIQVGRGRVSGSLDRFDTNARIVTIGLRPTWVWTTSIEAAAIYICPDCVYPTFFEPNEFRPGGGWLSRRPGSGRP